MFSVSVQTEDFNLATEVAKLRSGRVDHGAIVTFTGTVRDLNGDLEHLNLEHYPGMTEAELGRICGEAVERWPLNGCRVIHRHGKLAPGDNIVLVITLSAHREAAFQAAGFIMDFLKTGAPFWKKEKTSNGESWIDAKGSDSEARNRWEQ